MKAIVSISSMKENRYFHRKIMGLFEEVEYLDQRPSQAQIPSVLERCDAFIIGAREKIGKEEINEARSLPQFIGSLSVGLDHLDVGTLKSRDVKIFNSPTANTLSVAEHIIMFVFAFAKRLREAEVAVEGGLGRPGLRAPSFELSGKCFGTLGYGGIGKKVSQLADALGMQVIAHSTSRSSGGDGVANFVSLAELFQRSDFLSINVPLTDMTRGMVNSSLLEFMKPTALLINTSRTSVVEMGDVVKVLQNGGLECYALDADEISEQLFTRKDVMATPHIAGMTKEADVRLDNELIDNIEAYLAE